MLLEFVRRPACGNEMDFVEIETPVGGPGDGKVAIVNGIEGAAKKRDASWMVFCGGAVRLRGGQCVSQENLAGLDRIAGDGKSNFLMIS